LIKGEQSNTSVVFGDRLVLKFFRRLHAGVNPDVEIGRFLHEHTAYRNVPPLAGYVELRRPGQAAATAAILHGWIVNEADAWSYTLDNLKQYFEHCLAHSANDAELPQRHRVDLAEEEIPAAAQEMIGPYLTSAGLLGQRAGELHVALASATEDSAFAPEPFTPHYRHSLYQSLRSTAHKALLLLRERMSQLPEGLRSQAAELAGAEGQLVARYRALLDKKIPATRLRIHGDFHLGQGLFTGKDFVIIDFEGEPARTLGERRLKRSPLHDVAGMLRSFDYAAIVGVRASQHRREDIAVLEPWARYWNLWVGVAFVRRYLQAAMRGAFLPKTKEDLKTLLDILILDKAVYELNYELNNRPEWVEVPVRGILDLLNRSE